MQVFWELYKGSLVRDMYMPSAFWKGHFMRRTLLKRTFLENCETWCLHLSSLTCLKALNIWSLTSVLSLTFPCGLLRWCLLWCDGFNSQSFYSQITWGAWGTTPSWALHQTMICLRGRHCNGKSSHCCFRFNPLYTSVFLINLKLPFPSL